MYHQWHYEIYGCCIQTVVTADCTLSLDVGMVVEDCLLLLLNLLKHNVSNQNFLKEGSYIQRLPSCLDIEQTDQPGSDMWSAQKVTNVHLMLEVHSLTFLLNLVCILSID